MKKMLLLSLFLAIAVCAQDPDDDDDKPPKHEPAELNKAPAPQVVDTPADKVVAKIDGKEYTAGDIKKLINGYPPQIRNSFKQNPVRTLNYIFMINNLASQAEANKLDQNEEFKQNFEFSRINALSQAQLNYYRNSYSPTREEEKAFYEKNSERWDQAKFKVIYVSFSPGAAKVAAAASSKGLATGNAPAAEPPKPAGPENRTEAEAKLKIDDIHKQLDGGADFAKLAQENSDDKSSAAKGGDFGSLGRFSPYPDALKKTIFAMKPGEISLPVSQPNGFYIFKMDSISKQPFNDVEMKIFQELQQSHFNDWIKSTEKQFEVNVVDQQYFAGHPPR